MIRQQTTSTRFESWTRSIARAGLVGLALALSVMLRVEAPALAEMPAPEIVTEETVRVHVDTEAGVLSVEPPTVRIFLQWDPDRQDPLLATQVLWRVTGLQAEEVLWIRPKPGMPDIFPVPDDLAGRPAFRVDGRHNAIRSGEAIRLPQLVRGRGYLGEERLAPGAEPYSESWAYDVVVTDLDENVLLEIDPQVVVSGHP